MEKIQESWHTLQKALNSQTPMTSQILNRSASILNKTLKSRTLNTSFSHTKIPSLNTGPLKYTIKINSRVHSILKKPRIKQKFQIFSKKLFLAKCSDLQIPVNSEQQKRFYQYCSSHFKNRKISLSDQGLGQQSAKQISDFLIGNPNYSRLDFSNNRLKDRGLLLIARTVSLNKSIVHLDISNNELTPQGASKVLENLIAHQGIISLDFSSKEGAHKNRLSNQGARLFQQILAFNPILNFLNLSFCSIGDTGFKFLISGLQTNQSLLSLNLSNNLITSRYADRFCKTLVKSQLIELKLSENKLGDHFCDAFAALCRGDYEGTSALIKLEISGCQFGPESVSQFFIHLAANAFMKNLNISSNPLSNLVQHSLLTLLIQNNHLEQLSLYDTKLGNQGCLGFNRVLKLNTSLKNLDLSKNGLGFSTVQELAQGLKSNRTLKSLNLAYNEIQLNASKLLLSAMQTNKTLQVLNLKGNQIDDDIAVSFTQLARCKKNIIKLDLQDNPLSLKIVKQVNSHTKVNRKKIYLVTIPEIKAKISSLKLETDAFDVVQEKIQKKIMQKTQEIHKYEVSCTRFRQMRKTTQDSIKAIVQQHKKVKQQREKVAKKQSKYLGKLSMLKSNKLNEINVYQKKIQNLDQIIFDLQKKYQKIRENIQANRRSLNFQKSEEERLYNEERSYYFLVKNNLNYLKQQLKEGRMNLLRLKQINSSSNKSIVSKSTKNLECQYLDGCIQFKGFLE